MTTCASMQNTAPDTNNLPVVHVVAAVIYNEKGEILIAKRPDHVHQGGLWEFPGGKVEEGETAEEAIKRELLEELFIFPITLEPLDSVIHHYTDKIVNLEFFKVDSFLGKEAGLEQQELRWVAPRHLENYNFPAANKKLMLRYLLNN